MKSLEKLGLGRSAVSKYLQSVNKDKKKQRASKRPREEVVPDVVLSESKDELDEKHVSDEEEETKVLTPPPSSLWRRKRSRKSRRLRRNYHRKCFTRQKTK